MSKREAAAWKRRWRMVNRAEIEELRATPIKKKLDQLCVLMDSIDDIPVDEAREREVAEVRRRWNQLRRVLGGQE